MKQTNVLQPPVHPASQREGDDRDGSGSWMRAALPLWVLLPLRVFLGVTFVYAGLQKLTDSQYFNPVAVNFIGKQINRFALGSPIGGFLRTVAVPHATFFGGLVAYGELAIGLGVLAGVLVRPAAFFGMLINLIFFLSASWKVNPYFYGSDIVFAFAWVPLVLAGASGTGWPEFDQRIAAFVLRHAPRDRREQVVRSLYFVLGVAQPDVAEAEEAAPAVTRTVHVRGAAPARRNRPGRGVARASARSTRREFIRGAASGVVGTLVVVFLGSLFRQGDEAAHQVVTGNVPPAGGSTPAAAGSASTTVAKVSQVSSNSAVNFTVPGSGDPGVLVRLPSGTFVAYDAVCTHAGCTVEYDPGSHLLICPCHGAEFDPAHSADVVVGPAQVPLTTVNVSVDNATGAITVS